MRLDESEPRAGRAETGCTAAMSNRPALYVVRERGSAGRKIVPLVVALPGAGTAPARAVPAAWPRETAWRDLVRRLAKNPVET
jgi:hypothetical protein